MPYIIDSESGQLVWSGSTVPSTSYQDIVQIIAQLNANMVTAASNFGADGKILVSSGTGKAARKASTYASIDGSGNISGTSFSAGLEGVSTGFIAFRDGAEAAILGPSEGTLTASRTIILPNEDGTVALKGDADGNVRLGTNSLDALATGTNNIAIGDDALGALTSGSDMIAIGEDAALAVTSGSDSILIGERAGTAATSIASSVVIGDAAALVSTSLSQVVVVGKGACTTTKPGAQCVVIGNFAEVGADGETNEIVIGYNAVGSGTNTATIGNSSTLVTYIMGAMVLENPVVLGSYGKASLPTASSFAHGMIYVTDDVGGGTPAFSDGTNWRRTSDRNVIS